MAKRYAKKYLTNKQRDFLNSYNYKYGRIILCRDSIAIVINYCGESGAVDMDDNIIVPIKYCRIIKRHKFLYAFNSEEKCIGLYDIGGTFHGDFIKISKTPTPIILKIYNKEDHSFRLIIKQKHISKKNFNEDFFTDDLIMWIHCTDGYWGAIKGTKLLIPFRYLAITKTQHTYSFGLILNCNKKYDCDLIKTSEKKSKVIGRLFTNKTLNEIKEIFSRSSYTFEDKISSQVLDILNEYKPYTLEWHSKNEDIINIFNIQNEENNMNNEVSPHWRDYDFNNENCESEYDNDYEGNNYSSGWNYNDVNLLTDVFDGDSEAMASVFTD